MKLKILTFALLLIALCLSIFFGLKYKHLKSEHLLYTYQDSSFSHKELMYKRIYHLLSSKMNYSLIKDSNIIVDDINSNKILFKSLSNQKKTLFLRFTEFDCDVCYTKQIQNLKLMADTIGAESITLLVSFSSQNALTILKQTNSFPFQIYNIRKNDIVHWPLESLNLPYYFILDNKGIGSHYHILINDLPELNNQYLENVSQIFD